MIRNRYNRERRKVVFQFLIFFIGILLNFSGYFVLLNLQSSINIENGTGAASVTSTYVTASVFGITITPVLLRQFGTKYCVVLSEVTYLIYILLNYYPAYYTLIPGGVVVGMGEAILWPSMTIFSVHFAHSFAAYSEKSEEYYVTEFIGGFYLIFQLSLVVGNLLSYAVLYGGKTPPSLLTSNATESLNITPQDLSVCGGNDCQNPNITKSFLSRYEPTSQTLRYILIAVNAAMVIIAILMHSFLVEKIELNSPRKQSMLKDNCSNSGVEPPLKKPSMCQTMSSTLKATFLLIKNPKQLLLMPFTLYCGMLLYFRYGEITRAYGSCIFNVDEVGLLAALNGAVESAICWITSKMSSKYGRNKTVLFGFCFDIAFYITCLSWVPDENSKWVAYLIFAGIGISDGTWQPLVNELYAFNFPDKLEIAIPVWNLALLIGIAWQAGWSTSLCVFVKVYFQIGLLCFSTVCYVISQCLFHKKEGTEPCFPISANS